MFLLATGGDAVVVGTGGVVAAVVTGGDTVEPKIMVKINKRRL